MPTLHLRPRLLALARLVPPDARVADIGADHARLPLWLLQQGITNSVIAADINPQPLARGRALAEHVGLAEQVQFVPSDGLQALRKNDLDTVIIAGMGGETIIEILAAAPWSLTKHLLLQPMSRPERLTAWLDGQTVFYRQHLVVDSGRTYTIIECNRREST